MPAVDTAGTLDAILELADNADKLSGQLGGIEQLLLLIAERVEPKQPYFPSSTSLKLENSRVVASGNTQLYGISGVNTKASAQFILVFDGNTIPANGAVPEVILNAPASDNFWISWAPAWRNFSEGVILCNSTTAATLTIGAADCWFDAQYLALPPA
jgi:hypothetical protein